MAKCLVECLRGEERCAESDFVEFWHPGDGVDDELHMVWAINALTIQMAIANTTGLCPLVMPVETEMPLSTGIRNRTLRGRSRTS